MQGGGCIMVRYIFQLRRGRKETDETGTVTRDDWTEYTANKPDEAIPHEGELVLEYDNGTPRLKIGDGIHTFAELEYMSVDSFILPKSISVTIYPDKWVQASDDRWYQVVTVDNTIVTSHSKVDLQPSAEQLYVFHNKDLAFVTENKNGVVSVFCIGQVPTNEYIIRAIVTDVITDDETIIGNTITVPNSQSDSTQIEDILSRLSALEYVPIAINSFTNNIGTVELGTTINSITFSWSTNKTPTSLKIGTTELDASAKTYTLTGQSIASNTTYKLTAADEKTSVEKTTAVSFVNGIYYGVSEESTIDSAFILKLTKVLQGSRNKTFTVTAGSAQYIWYAVPTRYGTCTFNVGGFDGGFSLIDAVSFTNASNYTENYYVYRSDNANLGTQTVKVS